MTRRRRSSTYRDCVDWIAGNDEVGGDQTVDAVAHQIAVAMVADVWNLEQEDVARDVLKRRRELEKEEQQQRAELERTRAGAS